MVETLQIIAIVCVIAAMIGFVIGMVFKARKIHLWILTGGVFVAWWILFICAIQAIPQEYFTGFIYVIFFAAPILMVGNILSVFRAGTDLLYFWLTAFGGTRYVFSEVNSNSLAMARSIRKKKRAATIVFADTEALNTESDHAKELLEQVKDLNGICSNRQLSNMKLAKLFGKNEIYIIGEDESENVSQAIALTEKYKNAWTQTAIYVYASSDTANKIIDSIDKGEQLLNRAFENMAKENPKLIFDRENWEDMGLEGKFSIRCVDPVEESVLELLEESYPAIYKFTCKDKKRMGERNVSEEDDRCCQRLCEIFLSP